MVLEIVWIRHGHSCSNVISQAPESKDLEAAYEAEDEPQLTDIGFAAAQAARTATDRAGGSFGEFVDSADLVCASSMIRAIETALCVSTKPVVVLPFISEEDRRKSHNKSALPGRWLDEPDGRDEAKDKVNGFERVDYSFKDSFYYDSYSEPNFRAFVQEVIIDHWLNPRSSAYLGPGNRRVVIVSHGHFLTNNIVPKNMIWKRATYTGDGCGGTVSDTPILSNLDALLVKTTRAGARRWVREKGVLFKRAVLAHRVKGVEFGDTCIPVDYKPTVIKRPHVERCSDEVCSLFS